MKQGFLIVLCTAVVFAAGFGVRAWTEGVQPIPAAPAVSAGATPKAADAAQRQRTQIVLNIQRWTTDSDAFSKGVAALDAEFEAGFKALLTPRNEQARIEWQQSMQTRFGRGNNTNNGRGPGSGRGPDTRAADGKASDPKPMSDEEFERLRRAPLGLVARMLAVDEAVDLRRQQYALDEQQVAKTKALVQRRLDKFIALTSGISAMSIQVSALAQERDRLSLGVDPDSKAPATAAPKADAKAPESPAKAK
jgi:hypothetical protein